MTARHRSVHNRGKSLEAAESSPPLGAQRPCHIAGTRASAEKTRRAALLTYEPVLLPRWQW